MAAAKPPVSLARVKLYLRLISDESDASPHPEDNFILSLIDAAAQAVENEIQGKIGKTPPPALIQAMLMTIESLYDKRGEGDGMPMGARRLCAFYKNMGYR